MSSLNNKNNKKLALIHDWLITIGGAEKVLKSIYDIYHSSDLYILVGDNEIIKKLGFNTNVSYSFLQSLPKVSKYYKYLFPLFKYAVENINLSQYDVVISSSHSFAKGIITRPEQIHICYCHTPIRYAWDLYYDYLSYIKNPILRLIFKRFMYDIRIWDVVSSNRVDYFIANSKFVAKRIYKFYRREAKVIYPPVAVKEFKLEKNKEDFYLVVSRLVKHKRIDLIVKAFTRMQDKKLIIIGEGEELKNLKKIKTKNIKILGYRPFKEVKEYMEKAKAFISCSIEDFGIANVEAQACGTPVITLGIGGTLETVIDKKTGILFKRQSVEDIIDAVHEFEKMEFDYSFIRKNAERFSEERFKKEFKYFVENKINAK